MSFRRAVAFLSTYDQYQVQYRGEQVVGTHVLCLDLGLAFTQGTLYVFILSSLMAPETFDKVIKRFFEPRTLEISVGQSRVEIWGIPTSCQSYRHKLKSRKER
jgi:hypothetical protein